MKKFNLLISPLVALILELLPYGAVLNFANPEGEPFRETFSYFSLTPFGYANFGPFITAILTCAVILFVIINIFTSKCKIVIRTLSLLAGFTSLAPLLLGMEYFTIIGALITLCISIEIRLTTEFGEVRK